MILDSDAVAMEDVADSSLSTLQTDITVQDEQQQQQQQQLLQQQQQLELQKANNTTSEDNLSVSVTNTTPTATTTTTISTVRFCIVAGLLTRHILSQLRFC